MAAEYLDNQVSEILDQAIQNEIITTDCTVEKFKLSFSLNRLEGYITSETRVSIGRSLITRWLRQKIRALAKRGFANIQSDQIRGFSAYPETGIISKAPLLTFEFFVNME